MELHGIGELTAHGKVWRLVYGQCGHSQDFARAGLEDPQQAETYVRGGLAHCLSCQAAAAAETADGRRRDVLQLLERSAAPDPPARFGERTGRTRWRRRPPGRRRPPE
jgi:hypothetical protein